MKKRTVFWWIFLLSGIVWAVGGIGIVVGILVYPESNLLGGLGLVFAPIVLLGSCVFQIAFIVWVVCKILKKEPKKEAD